MNDTQASVAEPTEYQRVLALLGPRVSHLRDLDPWAAQETLHYYDEPLQYIANVAGALYLGTVVDFIDRPDLPPVRPLVSDPTYVRVSRMRITLLLERTAEEVAAFKAGATSLASAWNAAPLSQRFIMIDADHAPDAGEFQAAAGPLPEEWTPRDSAPVALAAEQGS